MAYYTYKVVRDLLPQHIIDAMGDDYEGGANYDGDQWLAAAEYIKELQQLVKDAPKFFSSESYDDEKREWFDRARLPD
jgi:hypothetical protein